MVNYLHSQGRRWECWWHRGRRRSGSEWQSRMPSGRDPIWQARGQLSGVRQARINPHLVAC